MLRLAKRSPTGALRSLPQHLWSLEWKPWEIWSVIVSNLLIGMGYHVNLQHHHGEPVMGSLSRVTEN